MKELMPRRIVLAAVLMVFSCSFPTPAQQAQWAEEGSQEAFSEEPGWVADQAHASPQQQQQRARGRGPGGRVEGMYKAQITPNWFANNTKFWYRNDLSGGAKEFILVDA